MTRNHVCLITALLASSAVAQGVTLKVAPSKSNVLQYTIETKSELKTDRKMTIDGEEFGGRGGRGGRGGGNRGPTKSSQKLVIQEGPAGSGWRMYVAAEASVTRPSRDGEDQTTKVAGALHGKKVFIEVKEGQVVFTEKDAKEAISQQVTRGIPASLNLSGLVSAKPVEVKGKYDIGNGLAAVIKDIMHPVRAGRGNRGGGRGRGGEGRGGRGGGQGRGGRGGEGRGGRGRGRGRRGRGANTFNDSAVAIFGSKKLTTQATGQLVSIEEQDGQKLATVKIEGEITGKGTPTELGLSRTGRGGFGGRGRGGRGGGRGGRGGEGRGGRGGGQAQDTGKATVTIKVTGTLVVNQTANRIETLNLKGTMKSNSESKRETQRGDMETKETRQASFDLKVTCVDKGAPKKEAPAKDKDGR